MERVSKDPKWLKPPRRWCATAFPTDPDGEKVTPVPRAGCAGFYEVPILTGSGKDGCVLRGWWFRSIPLSFQFTGDMCFREP